MKKLNVLLPILGVAATATTIGPMVSCNKPSHEVIKDVTIEEEQKEQESVGGYATYGFTTDASYEIDDFEITLTGTGASQLDIIGTSLENGHLNVTVGPKSSSNPIVNEDITFGINVYNTKDDWETSIDDLTSKAPTTSVGTASCTGGVQDDPVYPETVYSPIAEVPVNEGAAWSYYATAQKSSKNTNQMAAEDVLWSFTGGNVDGGGDPVDMRFIFQTSMEINVNRFDVGGNHLTSYSLRAFNEADGSEMIMVVSNVAYKFANHSPNGLGEEFGHRYMVPTFLDKKPTKKPAEEKWSMFYNWSNNPYGMDYGPFIVNQNSSVKELQEFYENSIGAVDIYNIQFGAATSYFLTADVE